MRKLNELLKVTDVLSKEHEIDLQRVKVKKAIDYLMKLPKEKRMYHKRNPFTNGGLKEMPTEVSTYAFQYIINHKLN